MTAKAGTKAAATKQSPREQQVVLTRDAILQAKDMDRRYVYVPEWDGGVWIRTLRADEFDEFQGSILDQRSNGKRRSTGKVDTRNLRAKLVVRCACDAEGHQIFDETDIPALGAKNTAALNRLWDVASELNGVTDADTEELAGNS